MLQGLSSSFQPSTNGQGNVNQGRSHSTDKQGQIFMSKLDTKVAQMNGAGGSGAVQDDSGMIRALANSNAKQSA
jgi:hypothetical protein